MHDLYHAFNGRRNGLLSCSELGAGLAWLQLQSQRPPRAGVSVDAMHEADVHALVRGLDTDGDGLLSLDEWAAAFPGLPDSEVASPNPKPDPSLPRTRTPTLALTRPRCSRRAWCALQRLRSTPPSRVA